MGSVPSIAYNEAAYTAIYVFSIVATCSVVFQIWNFLRFPGAAETISIVTWSMWTVSSVGWLVYAMMINDWGVFLSSFFGIVLYGFITLLGIRAHLINGDILRRAVELYERAGALDVTQLLVK
jgi:hypothetical protein